MAAERGTLRPLMYQAVEQGTSFNAFYRSAREHGISYRRSDMLSDYADVRMELASRERIRSLNAGDIPEATEVGAIKFTRPGAYYYRARVEVQTAEGAIPTQRFVTVVSEDQLTISGIMGQITQKWPTYEYGKRERLREIEIVAALHRAG